LTTYTGLCRLRDEKRDKWWEDEVGKVTAKLKVSDLKFISV
jgi:hypothetical protein